jgi:NADH dehydrogenase FAD-containing subunit
VTGFDLKARHVTAVQPGGQKITLSYDSLIVAAGVGQSYFGHDEYSEWAPGMKTLANALDQRARIFGAFEMAELKDDPEVRRVWLTFAVVGGGPTGVEIAGQIAELSRRALKRNFRRLDLGEVRVLLFEGGPEILATFGDNLSGKATRELARIGVEIHVRSIVTHLDADGIDVKGPNGLVQRYSAKTKIWAAGVAPSPLAKMLADATGSECDRYGRIKVKPDCSLPGHPEVFVVGDMMNFNDLPGVAEVALQSGLHAAHVIRKRVENGAEPTAWKYWDLGSMAAVARRSAIISAHGVRLRPDRLARVARRAHNVHDGLQEPFHGSHSLVSLLCRFRSLRTRDRHQPRPAIRPRLKTQWWPRGKRCPGPGTRCCQGSASRYFARVVTTAPPNCRDPSSFDYDVILIGSGFGGSVAPLHGPLLSTPTDHDV